MIENEDWITQKIDFVIPIKKLGMFTKAVLEGVTLFYKPRRIIVILPKNETSLFKKESQAWKVSTLEFIDENLYFMKNYGLTMCEIEKRFQTSKDEKHREFGWWYQQMIKLGASTQIEDISEHYVVWDGDLIPLKKWELVIKSNDENNIHYYVAMLQDHPRSKFNKEEYEKCIHYLLDFTPIIKKDIGTLVTHHMIFKVDYVKELIQRILLSKNIQEPWPLYFISLSRSFYRFSEYMLYASFMLKEHCDDFFYYPFKMYGKSGIRFRETDEIIQKIYKSYPFKIDHSFSYQEIYDYFRIKTEEMPSYVQFEHVYYLL